MSFDTFNKDKDEIVKQNLKKQLILNQKRKMKFTA